MWFWCVAVIVSVVLSGSHAGDPALPVLPNSFSASIEVNIVNKMETRNFHEWYDFEANQVSKDV